MQPATRINEFTLDIIEFCENDPYLYKELNKEREKFFTTTPEKYYKTFDEKNYVELRFADYFIFFYISQYYEMTPLEVFLSKMLSNDALNIKIKPIIKIATVTAIPAQRPIILASGQAMPNPIYPPATPLDKISLKVSGS